MLQKLVWKFKTLFSYHTYIPVLIEVTNLCTRLGVLNLWPALSFRMKIKKICENEKFFQSALVDKTKKAGKKSHLVCIILQCSFRNVYNLKQLVNPITSPPPPPQSKYIPFSKMSDTLKVLV